MAKPELGTKRVCLECSAKYFDLNRDPIVCPKCGTIFEIATRDKSRPAVEEPETKAGDNAEPGDVDETDAGEKAAAIDEGDEAAEIVSLNDADDDDAEEDGDDDAVPDLPDDDLIIDDDDDDNVFDKDDEEDEDVSDMIVGDDDDDS